MLLIDALCTICNKPYRSDATIPFICPSCRKVENKKETMMQVTLTKEQHDLLLRLLTLNMQELDQWMREFRHSVSAQEWKDMQVWNDTLSNLFHIVRKAEKK